MKLYHIKIATAIKLARNLYPLATKITVELINKPEAV